MAEDHIGYIAHELQVIHIQTSGYLSQLDFSIASIISAAHIRRVETPGVSSANYMALCGDDLSVRRVLPRIVELMREEMDESEVGYSYLLDPESYVPVKPNDNIHMDIAYVSDLIANDLWLADISSPLMAQHHKSSVTMRLRDLELTRVLSKGDAGQHVYFIAGSSHLRSLKDEINIRSTMVINLTTVALSPLFNSYEKELYRNELIMKRLGE